MARKIKYQDGRTVLMAFSTSQELKEWFLKKYPKDRSAVLTRILLSHKEQTEKAS